MNGPRLLQLAGIIIVGFVLFASLTSINDMTFEFGGLIIGAAVFVLGKFLERPAEG